GIAAVRVPAGDRAGVVERDGARAAGGEPEDDGDREGGTDDEQGDTRAAGHGSSPDRRLVGCTRPRLGGAATCGNGRVASGTGSGVGGGRPGVPASDNPALARRSAGCP